MENLIFDVKCELCGNMFVSKRLSGNLSEPARYCPKCRVKGYILARQKNGNCRSAERYTTYDGYIMVRLSDKNEYGTSQYEAEHRLVMSRLLGRPLRKGESVHHKDGNRSNNIPQNLELWLKPQMYGIRASELTCPHCGKSYYSSII